MKDESHISLAEIQGILDEFLAIGLVRPSGKYRNGGTCYELTPDAEQSFEARTYATYLKSLSGDPPVN